MATCPNTSFQLSRMRASRTSCSQSARTSAGPETPSGAATGAGRPRDAHCSYCSSRNSLRGSSAPSPGESAASATPSSSGAGCVLRYSLQIARTRSDRGERAPTASPASSSASSTTARSSGGMPAWNSVHLPSSSGSVAASTSFFNARTVPARARSTQSASVSPRAAGITASACRGDTSPARTAARSSGRLSSSRASRSSFCAVLAAIPSSSRAKSPFPEWPALSAPSQAASACNPSPRATSSAPGPRASIANSLSSTPANSAQARASRSRGSGQSTSEATDASASSRASSEPPLSRKDFVTRKP